MSILRPLTLGALIASALPGVVSAAEPAATLQQLQQEIEDLKRAYATHIQQLETRLKAAEDDTAKAQATADQAARQTAQPAAPQALQAPPASSNAFNPDISLVLSGLYANLSRDPSSYRLAGFIPGGEIGPGDRGFGLTESELGISANIDPWFYGAMNFSIHPDDTVSAEEAFVQTTALSDGFKLKAGRFFSGIGYLNEQHGHTWDFVDAPLAYQAFLGSQFGQDGVQLKWLAPTDTFLELGAELGNGKNFPGSDRNKNGAGAQSVFAHVGGDVGLSNSWRAGVSYLHTSPVDRSYDDTDISDNTVNNAFTGNSRLWIADFVWKWAPNGNGERTNFKLQGEYFQRQEIGSLAYDVDATNASDAYRSSQSGWYLQGVYQFMPTWRVGARYDRLDGGTVNYGSNAAFLASSDYTPTRSSLMLDWTPSEFSRIRLQAAQDRSRPGATDHQLFLQYQMSLGAHGAHIF